MAFSDKWQYDVDNAISALDNTDKALKATLDIVDRKHNNNYSALELRVHKLEERPDVLVGDSFLARLKSRKLWLAIGGATTAIIGMIQGSVPTDVGILAVQAVIMAYIGVEGYADAQSRKKD